MIIAVSSAVTVILVSKLILVRICKCVLLSPSYSISLLWRSNEATSGRRKSLK